VGYNSVADNRIYFLFV